MLRAFRRLQPAGSCTTYPAVLMRLYAKVHSAEKPRTPPNRSRLSDQMIDDILMQNKKNQALDFDDDDVEEGSGTSSGKESGVYINPVTGEVGGPRGPEPVRYGDWEIKGRCSDF